MKLLTLEEKILRNGYLRKTRFRKREIFCYISHREENINYETNFLDLVDSLNAVAENTNTFNFQYS